MDVFQYKVYWQKTASDRVQILGTMQADVPFMIDAAASNLDYYLEKSWTKSQIPL